MRIRRAIALALVAGWIGAPSVRAAEIEGVSFPDRREVDGVPLHLNGVGLLRYRWVVKGYVAALYLGEEVTPAQALDDVPRRLEIEYFWSIPSDAFARATIEGIGRNVDAESFEGLRSRIDQLNALYVDVEPGDRYSLTYVPGVGTELAWNGDPRGVIAGADFSAALFAIWIGERALDESLREQLLATR